MAKVYDVYTNLDEDTLTDVGFLVMKKWIAFAMGLEEIGGHRIENPTGRYASSIRLEGRGYQRIAIVADAPEAEILEEGHAEIDLKTKLGAGRAYPMHRGAAGEYGSAGYGPMFVTSSMSARKRNVWAVARSMGYTGYARVPSEITAENADSWVIPAMPAWSPAQHLKDLIENGSIFDGR